MEFELPICTMLKRNFFHSLFIIYSCLKAYYLFYVCYFLVKASKPLCGLGSEMRYFTSDALKL